MKINLIKIFYLPPPNITGKLHIGHVLNFILTDIIIRINKLRGYKTLWIPGLDHAGIATQNLIEKFLYNFGINKKNTKKKFFKFFFRKWKKKYSSIIIKQIKTFNVSLNWKFKYFTLNKLTSKIIKKIFIRLYKKNLIKKKNLLINWDKILKLNISDIEIKKFYKKIYNIKLIYILIKKKGFFIKNKINNFYYRKFKINKINNIIFFKKKILIPYLNIKIPIIFKNLKYKNYNKNFFYKKNSYYSFYILKKYKIIIKVKYKYVITNKSERSKSKIKYIKKLHWFILIKKKILNLKLQKKFSIKNILIRSFKKKIKIIPKKWKIYYTKWILKIKNWCISRKLWIGHKIPIFYKKNKFIIINKFKEKLIKKKYSFLKEKQVLDTWFSSSLIPIISKFLIKKKLNFKNFIKSDLIITGYDIIFFWIIRMVIFSLYFLKKLPFKCIYIHGLIVDNNNKKMSKSVGNIITPNELIKNKFYNIDSLRYIISSLNNKKKFIKFNINYKNYLYLINKIKNLTNFIINNCRIYKNFFFIEKLNKNKKKQQIIDKWILSIIEENKSIIYKNFIKLNLEKNNLFIYKLIKNLYSNCYLNLIKISLKINSINNKYLNCVNTLYSFLEIIKLIYPIIPKFSKKIIKSIWYLLKIYNINNKINMKLELNLINIHIKLLNIIFLNYIKIIKNYKKKIIILYTNNFKILNYNIYINKYIKKIITNKEYML